MSTLAPTLQGFFTERLIGQRQASPHTITSYRDTFRLLLCFAQRRTGKPPFALALEDLDATLIGAFLELGTSSTTVGSSGQALLPVWGMRGPKSSVDGGPATRTCVSFNGTVYCS